MYLVTPVHAFYVSNAPRNNMRVFKNTRLPTVQNSRKTLRHVVTTTSRKFTVSKRTSDEIMYGIKIVKMILCHVMALFINKEHIHVHVCIERENNDNNL